MGGGVALPLRLVQKFTQFFMHCRGEKHVITVGFPYLRPWVCHLFAGGRSYSLRSLVPLTSKGFPKSCLKKGDYNSWEPLEFANNVVRNSTTLEAVKYIDNIPKSPAFKHL